MPNRIAHICSSAFLAFALMMAPASPGIAENSKPAVSASGVIATKSVFGVAETVVFFQEIDQAALAGRAGIDLKPSVLLIFGNPPLGTQFITAAPQAGLDWPVRMLVYRDTAGQVWVAYSDFGWIAKRHGITDRDAQFRMASQVAASIASSVSPR